MKRKYYILGTLALLCLLGTGYYAWTLYDAHCKQVAEWNEGAKAAFEEALWLEVNKRAEIPIYHSASSKHGMESFNEILPDTIFITTSLGRKGYYIAPIRYERSFIKNKDKNMMLGALLYEYPLCLDTLAMHWNANLTSREIPAQSRIRYVYTDWNLQNDTVCSDSSNHLGLDSLTVSYLGFRCEHELVAYTSYPSWISSLSFSKCCRLFFPIILLGILFVCYDFLEKFFRRKLVKEKVVEREIHVADVAITQAKVYQLPDGSLFDSLAGTLKKGEIINTLPPQSVILLRLFLRKENHHLSSAEIEQELWNGNGSIDKLHKAMQRLRADLKKVTSEVVIKNVNGDYELKSPIPSSILPEMED